MRIGTDSWPGSAPLHLASQMGSLDSRFRLVDFSTTSESVRSFRNGALDAACLTLDEALRVLRDGMDPVILLLLDESTGGDALVAQNHFATIKDLKGKRIGVELGGGGSLILTRALGMAGMSVNDVTLIYLPTDKHVESFQAGDVDAVATYEPARTRLQAAGGNVLFDSAMIPGEVFDIMIAHGSFVRQHPELVRALRKAWADSVAHLQAKPAVAIPAMAQRLQMTPAQFEAMLGNLRIAQGEENLAFLGGVHPKLKDSAARLMALMRQSALLSEDVNLDPLFSAPPE